MIIIGAKGFAKEVLQIAHLTDQLLRLSFYDDVSKDIPDTLFETFPVLRSEQEVLKYFKLDDRFAIGIGNPLLRHKMDVKFSNLGGTLTSLISPRANIGSYGITIGAGSCIMDGAILSNDVVIGKGCIVYYNTIVTHDCVIGDFVEISPGAKILGRAQIGNYCQIGANATILPDIHLGTNVIVGAGAVVTKDVPDNCIVAGVPAKILRQTDTLNLEL
jgi:sugar O-acyltransferase (sialic acid O-acetyltransferase NeuD family)